MFELGQLLKNARLEKGISIDQLQETTKIRKRYLEAIEEGNFKVLPGNFYVRAFIKNYAEAVGMDPNEVLRMYKSEIPGSPPETTPEPLRRSRTAPKPAIKWSRYVTGIVLWSFLILILAVLYYFIGSNYKSSGKNSQFTDAQTQHLTDKTPGPSGSSSSPAAGGNNGGNTATPSATPSPTPAPTPTPTPVPAIKLVKSENGVDYYSATPGTVLTVELRIIQSECWFKIDKNTPGAKMTLEQGTMASGSSRTWTSDQPVFLTLGRANAAELKVNGTLIPVGDAPNAKRFQFDFIP